MKKKIMNTVNNVRNIFIKTASHLKDNVAYTKLSQQNGQFAMDNIVVFAIILVVGAVAIALLVAYLKGDLSSLMSGKVNSLFN